tara:strand:+ start:745 stop:891 length:147 start_codon:yes stop_codon:yes gene_type:complete
MKKESPTTGAGLSDISGADVTVMRLFWLSFTVYRSRQIQHLQNSIIRD